MQGECPNQKIHLETLETKNHPKIDEKSRDALKSDAKNIDNLQQLIPKGVPEATKMEPKGCQMNQLDLPKQFLGNRKEKVTQNYQK